MPARHLISVLHPRRSRARRERRERREESLSRRPTISCRELERLYTYGTLLRLR